MYDELPLVMPQESESALCDEADSTWSSRQLSEVLIRGPHFALDEALPPQCSAAERAKYGDVRKGDEYFHVVSVEASNRLKGHT